MKTEFSPNEYEIMWNEGWSVFNTSTQDATHNLWELQAVAEKGIFKDDDEAIEFVFSNAEKNSESIYGKAVRFLAEESPNEIDSIFTSAMGNERVWNYLSSNNICL